MKDSTAQNPRSDANEAFGPVEPAALRVLRNAADEFKHGATANMEFVRISIRTAIHILEAKSNG